MKPIIPSIEPLESRITPATFVVTSLADSNAAGTLRTALADADAALLLHPGVVNTITFHLPAPPLHGENIITLSSLGTLKSNGDVNIVGPGSGKLIVSGGGKYEVFNFNDGTSADNAVTISGLSVVDGNTSNSGGGIYSAESLTLKNVIVSGNTSSFSGGGVAVNGGDLPSEHVSISNSVITGNSVSSVDGFGGGLNLYQLKSISISNTVVTGNTSTGNEGGIYAQVTSTGTGIAITGCQISGNTAGSAGGLFVVDDNSAPASKITISGTKITGNVSTSTGTGAGGGGLSLGAGNAVISGSLIRDNSAVYSGGGIEAKGFTSLTITGSTITGNQTTTVRTGEQGGAGVFIEGPAVVSAAISRPLASETLPTATITGSVITDNNSLGLGGGVFAYGGVTLNVSGTTFSGNHSTAGGAIATYGMNSDRVNLTVSGGTFSDNSTLFANDMLDGSGGAIWASGGGAISITGSKLTGNVSGGGGGAIFAYGVFVNIKNVVATGNIATTKGGGLSLEAPGGFKISGGSFSGNSGTYGGGIEIYASTGSIEGVTISGNAATTEAGGVYNGGATPGTVTLQIAKVTANSAPVGADVDDTPGDLSTFVFV